MSALPPLLGAGAPAKSEGGRGRQARESATEGAVCRLLGMGSRTGSAVSETGGRPAERDMRRLLGLGSVASQPQSVSAAARNQGAAGRLGASEGDDLDDMLPYRRGQCWKCP
eukprot:9237839-Heterocapsa_arctica.AAC.1